MKLTDKRFWIWIVLITIMSVMMGVFTGLVLCNTFIELFHYQNIELFLLWEVAYLIAGYFSIVNCMN